ncbi:MAG: hypothetical protein WCV50_04440 [Patescibacteria group bacterium]|jgi:hypothetical protein
MFFAAIGLAALISCVVAMYRDQSKIMGILLIFAIVATVVFSFWDDLYFLLVMFNYKAPEAAIISVVVSGFSVMSLVALRLYNQSRETRLVGGLVSQVFLSIAFVFLRAAV